MDKGLLYIPLKSIIYAHLLITIETLWKLTGPQNPLVISHLKALSKINFQFDYLTWVQAITKKVFIF